MAAVTENKQFDVQSGANTRDYNVTVASTGDTLDTPFTEIKTVQLTPNFTTDATTYYDYTTSGGTITINGGGTGFDTGEFSVTVKGDL